MRRSRRAEPFGKSPLPTLAMQNAEDGTLLTKGETGWC